MVNVILCNRKSSITGSYFLTFIVLQFTLTHDFLQSLMSHQVFPSHTAKCENNEINLNIHSHIIDFFLYHHHHRSFLKTLFKVIIGKFSSLFFLRKFAYIKNLSSEIKFLMYSFKINSQQQFETYFSSS